MTEYLKKLVEDYSTRKQLSLIQMKKGSLSKDAFLQEAKEYAKQTYMISEQQAKELVVLFEQYIFGYSKISPLIDDEEVSRTDYLSDVGNGKSCTFFDLNIVIDRIYSKVTFRLYDYDTGYSSGSDYISGIYTTSFYEFWGQNSFTLKVSDLEFTVYGTWY